MIILGIESSCDETAAALVENGTTLKSQSLATSLSQHVDTGGVVPEIAARAQIESIIPVLQSTLSSKGVDQKSEVKSTQSPISRLHPQDIDAIAVTTGPGLVGSLLIGVETAKSLALAWNKPIIPVNHMLGHIYGAWLTHGETLNEAWPKLALLVSGGHTELILMESHQKFYKVGWTLDDAAGEAFDKAAKLLGLPYPGGPALSKLALEGQVNIQFPNPLPERNNLNFSFSGLKTALFNYLKQNPEANKADVAASFQQAIIKSLVLKTKRAAEQYQVKVIILGGGVAANQSLRKQLVDLLHPTPVHIPAMEFTTDNAAVIASAAFYHNQPHDWRNVQANPSLELPIKTSALT